jgi:hypothetical protein
LQLGERPLDPVPEHGHRAGDALITRAVLLQLGEKRDVLFPEDLDLGTKASQRGGQVGSGEAGRDQPPSQLHAPLLHAGQHLGGESEVIGFLISIAGIHRVGNHRPGSGLAYQLLQSRPFP